MGSGGHDGRLGGRDEGFLGRRVFLIGVLMALVFLVFFLRLFQLQVIDAADLRNRSDRNRVRTVRLEAQRGVIVDREGRALAASRPAFGVAVIPDELSERDRTLRAMGGLLQREPSDLDEKVGKRRGRDRFKPVLLARDVGPDTLAQVQAHQFLLSGLNRDPRFVIAIPSVLVRGRHDALAEFDVRHDLGSASHGLTIDLDEDLFGRIGGIDLHFQRPGVCLERDGFFVHPIRLFTGQHNLIVNAFVVLFPNP